MRIVPKRSTEFAGTYNTVRQKEAAPQSSNNCRLAVGSRSRPITPQPATTALQLSNTEKQTGSTRENELTERSRDSYRGKDAHKPIPVVDVVHSINLLIHIISNPRLRHRIWVGEVL